MASIMSLQVYLDQAKVESESETKASGVRQRAELQKLIKTATVLRKQILAHHKKPVSDEETTVEEKEEVEEPTEVKEEKKEEPKPKKKAKAPKKK
jgi:phosphoribosyl 1,2-cyclic phosphodiesterase